MRIVFPGEELFEKSSSPDPSSKTFKRKEKQRNCRFEGINGCLAYRIFITSDLQFLCLPI
jgi:hypothetical protein